MGDSSIWESVKYLIGLCIAPLLYIFFQKYKTNGERISSMENKQIDIDKKAAIADLRFADIVDDIKEIKLGMNRILDLHFTSKMKK